MTVAGGPSVLGRLMLAFQGHELPDAVRARLAAAPAAGVTLFRYPNIRDAAQVRRLTADLQAAASETLLIAADQEAGQFMALGDGTPFAGNMALGAVGDERLAERVGAAIGRELRAVGVNVDAAPVCDVASNPANPALGIRSFGDDPAAVGRLAAATVRGLQSAGVAACAKHFPGLGDLSQDSHHVLATVGEGQDRRRFDEVELVPFRAAIDAGVRLVMSAHVAAPALDGDPGRPATLSRSIMSDLLRGELGHRGLTITDALDMGAIAQGDGQIVDVIAAVRAGVDLLLCAPDAAALARLEAGLVHAEARGLFDPGESAASAARLAELRRWIDGFEQPPLEVVGCEEHLALSRELAERSVTLVRDDAALVPLRPEPSARILVLQPRPVDLTPADTTSQVEPALASAFRRYHDDVDEIVYDVAPIGSPDIGALRASAATADLVVLGTAAASLDPAQAELANAILSTGVPTVTVALRTPFDLAVYPAATTHACTYGILRPSLDALAAALFGRIPFCGTLPAGIPGSAPTGDNVA